MFLVIKPIIDQSVLYHYHQKYLKKLLMTRFMNIWKTFYSKLEKMHHKTLNQIFGIDDSYKNLLLRSEYVSVHQKLLRFLVTETFKSKSQINPEFIWSFFKQKKSSYSLRKGSILNVPITQSTN